LNLFNTFLVYFWMHAGYKSTLFVFFGSIILISNNSQDKRIITKFGYKNFHLLIAVLLIPLITFLGFPTAFLGVSKIILVSFFSCVAACLMGLDGFYFPSIS
jgi:hypothetical protein